MTIRRIFPNLRHGSDRWRAVVAVVTGLIGITGAGIVRFVGVAGLLFSVVFIGIGALLTFVLPERAALVVDDEGVSEDTVVPWQSPI